MLVVDFNLVEIMEIKMHGTESIFGLRVTDFQARGSMHILIYIISSLQIYQSTQIDQIMISKMAVRVRYARKVTFAVPIVKKIAPTRHGNQLQQ